jgi:DNA-binding IclR family transcriptional regulator
MAGSLGTRPLNGIPPIPRSGIGENGPAAMKQPAETDVRSAHLQSLRESKPGVSPANRSLERGIELLRSFRPGSELLGNAELAERTGLSRSTVSRLTQTLVGSGLLQVDPRSRAFRLAPAVLSFAHAMRTGSTLLATAAPMMRQVAEARKINVGLAAPDRDEMVYLESIRYNRRPSLRTVVSGQRVPMELTSLGRAYLASASEARRKALLAHFREARAGQWRRLGAEIALAIESVAAHDYCAASWQPEVAAVATPLLFQGACYALNVSVSSSEAFEAVVRELAPALIDLKQRILSKLEAAAAN